MIILPFKSIIHKVMFPKHASIIDGLKPPLLEEHTKFTENILAKLKSNIIPRSYKEIAHLHSTTDVPTKYKLSTPYGF